MVLKLQPESEKNIIFEKNILFPELEPIYIIYRKNRIRNQMIGYLIQYILA